MTAQDVQDYLRSQQVRATQNHPDRHHPHVQQIAQLALHLRFPLHSQPGAHILDTKQTTYLIGYTDEGEFVEASGNGWVFTSRDDGPDRALQQFITHIKHHR